jgi:hypothetical protein
MVEWLLFMKWRFIDDVMTLLTRCTFRCTTLNFFIVAQMCQTWRRLITDNQRFLSKTAHFVVFNFYDWAMALLLREQSEFFALVLVTYIPFLVLERTVHHEFLDANPYWFTPYNLILCTQHSSNVFFSGIRSLKFNQCLLHKDSPWSSVFCFLPISLDSHKFLIIINTV